MALMLWLDKMMMMMKACQQQPTGQMQHIVMLFLLSYYAYALKLVFTRWPVSSWAPAFKCFKCRFWLHWLASLEI
jgi:hypothetical protein